MELFLKVVCFTMIILCEHFTPVSGFMHKVGFSTSGNIWFIFFVVRRPVYDECRLGNKCMVNELFMYNVEIDCD
jgi:hypothetical protein